MSLLDGGIANIFASVLVGLYLDAVLHKRSAVDDGTGSVTVTWADHDCKAQPDMVKESMYALGFTGQDILIRVLAPTLDVTPNTDDEITILSGVHAGRWSISQIPSDGAGAYHEFGGRVA